MATAAIIISVSGITSVALAQGCDKEAFAAVVSETGAALNTINDRNKKPFQDKLLALKAARGWSGEEYVAQATPFVKDEKTASLDAANQALLAKLQSLGGESGLSDDKRCAMLAEMKAIMAEVVSNTEAKWAYMMAKVTAANPGSLHAGAAR